MLQNTTIIQPQIMKNPIISDSVLVALYANGNEQAFEKLFKRYQMKVQNTIYLIVKDKDVAQDLLQETFIKAVRTIKQGKYNDEGKFSSWITRIGHNIAIDFFRKNKRYPTTELDTQNEFSSGMHQIQESFEDTQIRNEIHEKVRQLVEELPKKQKEVLIMRHYSDMSFQEIAQATNVSINTALGRMRYALINLRKQAEKYNICFENTLAIA